MPEIDTRIIRITDDAIPVWSDDLQVPDGEPGELVVSGPVVTKAYFGLPDATAYSKIVDGGRIWHRIGDIGYRDPEGRLWFCGRKSHRVVTPDGMMLSVCCEAIFNEHPEVYRSALVGVGPRGRQEPVIVVEPHQGSIPKGRRVASFTEELRELGAGAALTSGIRRVLFHPALPVDVRHNAKINREQLAEWVSEQRS